MNEFESINFDLWEVVSNDTWGKTYSWEIYGRLYNKVYNELYLINVKYNVLEKLNE